MGDRNDQACCENKNKDTKETGKTTSHVDIVDKELENEASLGIEKVNDKGAKKTGKDDK